MPKRNKEYDKARKIANNYMRMLHPEIDWHIHCVHHIDGNPLNNDVDNLKIINKSTHTRLHRRKHDPKIKFGIIILA